ncbi:MAG: carboxypeptidase regulatory-like domain-containing protein [Bacteroidetes bacterium]|nr:carboxypeptidase regulatory-like domain-containing protein [Bacteroidota bacterium]
MTDSQENKFNSFEATDYFLNHETIKPIWEGDADFAALVTLLGLLITDIRNLHSVQVVDNTGITVVKSDVRRQLTDAMLMVIYAVEAHAIFTNDPQLQSSVSYTLTELIKLRDNVLADTALSIYNIAWPIRVALAARKLTEADITKVNELQQQYAALISEPRFALGKSMSATKDIREKMAQIDDLLKNKIDRTIKIFKTDHPDFIDQYFVAREIIDLGVRHRKQPDARVTGTVVQAGTLIALQNASVTVVGTMRKTKTDVNGGYSLIFKTKSSRIIRVMLENHEIFTSNLLQIKPGDVITLNIQLKPIE